MHLTVHFDVINIHLHLPVDEQVAKKLDQILKEIKRSQQLMNAETQAVLERIDTASSDLAGDLQRLIDAAAESGSLTEAQIRAALEPRVIFLEQLAHVSDAPVPDPPPSVDI